MLTSPQLPAFRSIRRRLRRLSVSGAAVAIVAVTAVAPAHAAVQPVSILAPATCMSTTVASGGTTWQQQLAGDYGTQTTYAYVIASRPTAVANYRGTAGIGIVQQLEFLGSDGRWHLETADRPSGSVVMSSYRSGSSLYLSRWNTSSPTFNAAVGYRYAVLTTTYWFNSANKIFYSYRTRTLTDKAC